jgi:hypothetical protein
MRPKIALFVHQPKCSIQSGNGIIRALSLHYDFKIFTKHELEKDFFDDVDIVCFPGGFGDSDSYDYLMKTNKNQIYDFLHNGGTYLGICMGAYWADKDYFNLLHGIRVEQYIRQPTADTRRPHAKEMPVVWQGEKTSMYFYDGPTFVKDPNYVPLVYNPYETVSTYTNGDPMAIVGNKIGLIACHPEADQHWYESYSWMRKHWNGGKHQYLLNFVNYLMKK